MSPEKEVVTKSELRGRLSLCTKEEHVEEASIIILTLLNAPGEFSNRDRNAIEGVLQRLSRYGLKLSATPRNLFHAKTRGLPDKKRMSVTASAVIG